MSHEEVIPVEAVRIFRNFATKYLGVEIDQELEPLVGGRIAKRLGQLHIPLHKYIARLYQDKDAEEIVAFLDFVRARPAPLFARRLDHAQLRVRMRERLGEGCRRFRLWSAGCGTGEEAYAMALSMVDAIESEGLNAEEVDFEVLATDLSERTLAMGRQGLFEQAQLCKVPATLRRRHFFRAYGGIAISDALQSRVVFRRLNLAQTPLPIKGMFDTIFCHEALIPMVPRARAAAVEAMTGVLAEDGLIRTGFEHEMTAATAARKPGLLKPRTPGVTRYPSDC